MFKVTRIFKSLEVLFHEIFQLTVALKFVETVYVEKTISERDRLE